VVRIGPHHPFFGIGHIMEKDATASLLNELIASRKLIVSSKGPLWYVFPGIKQKLYMKYVYDTKLALYKSQGVQTIEESLKTHKDLGLWDDLKEKNLTLLPKFIKETEENIKKEPHRARKKKFELWLRTLQREYVNLMNGRNTTLLNSAEYLANDAATHYLMWECIRNYDDSRIWPTFEDAQNSSDIEYLEELSNLFLEASKDSDESDLRKIARMGMWRIRWRAVEGDMNELFGRTAQDLTNDQFLLIYWSQVYDSVYENMERPPDSIIEDDDALDEWLKLESEKRDREVGQRYYGKSNSKPGHKSKIDNATEVFKVIDGAYNEKGEFVPYTEEQRWAEIERIRKLNSPMARAIKQREEKMLAKTPGVFFQEHELRRDKTDRETMGGNVDVVDKRKR